MESKSKQEKRKGETMTHYETMMKSKADLAEVICRHLECEACPASALCRAGNNGMQRWLDLEDSADDDGLEEDEEGWS